MASLDIVNVYPSITWEMIENKLTQINIEPEIIDLIEFAYRSNYLEIKGRYFTQTEGISMGSVIGPKLAELVMIDIDDYISKIPGIYFCRRYVDDIFVLYKEKQVTLEQIKDVINKITKTIQFTTETEINQEINYLDITIIRKKNEFKFKTFKKSSSMQTTVKYNSNIPLYIKQNIFSMEYNKIKNRTSKCMDIDNDIKSLKKKFLLNGYPNRLLTNWEEKINNVNNKKNPEKNEIDNGKISNENKMKYIPFPYIKGLYEKINKEIRHTNVKLAPKYKNFFVLTPLFQPPTSITNTMEENQRKALHPTITKINELARLTCVHHATQPMPD
ncbi:uncharacterized protein LOC111624601 [Centruroides sculpturatus]|uniref:uncharacterized protein LOC111624601 n=1 Tax=Centruroides sculpturatus TaxID=218467 RepID=UPI000C6E0999|nr:uncharacterized protein LOC111624601 [Centruroides sculpturatus]